MKIAVATTTGRRLNEISSTELYGSTNGVKQNVRPIITPSPRADNSTAKLPAIFWTMRPMTIARAIVPMTEISIIVCLSFVRVVTKHTDSWANQRFHSFYGQDHEGALQKQHPSSAAAARGLPKRPHDRNTPILLPEMENYRAAWVTMWFSFCCFLLESLTTRIWGSIRLIENGLAQKFFIARQGYVPIPQLNLTDLWSFGTTDGKERLWLALVLVSLMEDWAFYFWIADQIRFAVKAALHLVELNFRLNRSRHYWRYATSLVWG